MYELDNFSSYCLAKESILLFKQKRISASIPLALIPTRNSGTFSFSRINIHATKESSINHIGLSSICNYNEQRGIASALSLSLKETSCLHFNKYISSR